MCLFQWFTSLVQILCFTIPESLFCSPSHFHISILTLHFLSLHFAFQIDYLTLLARFINFIGFKQSFVLSLNFFSLAFHSLSSIYRWTAKSFTFLSLMNLKFLFFCSFLLVVSLLFSQHPFKLNCIFWREACCILIFSF